MMLRSKVVVIKGEGVLTRGGGLDSRKLSQLFQRGLSLFGGGQNPSEALRHLVNKKDRVGIKINTIAGKSLSTRPEVAFSLVNLMTEAGISENDILVWDRTNRELKSAGYHLNLSQSGIKVFGTDSKSVGYDPFLTMHANIGSMYSTIQSRWVSSSISLAILKDHGLAGVTAGMKNYFGVIHNPNKYHDFNCNPYIPELFESHPIKSKHRISILDCLLVQYHRGPSFHSKWAEILNTLIFSEDPVAADFIGWQTIEKLRAKKGIPSLREEEREPLYLKTAEIYGLGNASEDGIELIEEEI